MYGASPPRVPPARSLSSRLRAVMGFRGGNPAMALYQPTDHGGALPDSVAGSPLREAGDGHGGQEWFSLNRLVT